VPRLMFTQGIAIAALFCATLPPAASAEEQKYPTKIIATPLSPVTLTNCYGVKDAIGVIYVTNSLINRSSLFLTAYVVRWYAYDNSGVPMGQNDFTYSFQNDLAPGDTTQASQGVYFLTEPDSALATVSCRIESAKFEGGRSWTYGRPWHGHLAPLPHSR